MNASEDRHFDGTVPCILIFQGRSFFGWFLAMADPSLQSVSGTGRRISDMAMPDRLCGCFRLIELSAFAE
jgi:hypothetical protein